MQNYRFDLEKSIICINFLIGPIFIFNFFQNLQLYFSY